MSNNIELSVVETFDLSTNGYIDTEGLIITDEKRGWIYRFDNGSDAQTTATVSVSRYNLDFDLNSEEVWTPNDTYGASYGQLYRQNFTLYDYDTGNFIFPMTADDEITGASTIAGYLAKWTELVIDQNDLTNSTVNVIGTYSISPSGGADLSNDLRVIHPIYYDRDNNKIYYQRGQAGTVGSDNSGLNSYDLTNDTFDLNFYDPSLEGITEAFIFNPQTEVIKGLMSRFDKEFTSSYDLIYYEFGFGGSGSIIATSSNSIAGYRISVYDFKEIGKNKIEFVFSNRAASGTQNRPEFPNGNIFKTLFDKNLNTLQIKSKTYDGTYDTRVRLDYYKNELLGTTDGGDDFIRLIEKQRKPQDLKLSGEIELDSFYFNNVTGDESREDFRFNSYDRERNLLVNTRDTSRLFGNFDDQGFIEYTDTDLTGSASRYDLPSLLGSVYYQCEPYEDLNNGYFVTLLRADHAILDNPVGVSSSYAFVRFDIDFDDINNTTYSVIGEFADYTNMLYANLILNQILDYDETTNKLWFAQREQAANGIRISELDLDGKTVSQYKNANIPTRVHPNVKNGFVSPNEIYFTCGVSDVALDYLSNSDTLVKYDFIGDTYSSVDLFDVVDNSNNTGSRNVAYQYEDGFVYKIATGDPGVGNVLYYGQYGNDLELKQLIRTPQAAVDLSTGVTRLYSIYYDQLKEIIYIKSGTGPSLYSNTQYFSKVSFTQDNNTIKSLPRKVNAYSIDSVNLNTIHDINMDDIFHFDKKNELVYIANSNATIGDEVVIRQYDTDLNLVDTLATGCSQSFFNIPFYEVSDKFYVHDRFTNVIKQIDINVDNFTASNISTLCGFVPPINFSESIIQVLHIDKEYIYIFNSTQNGSNGNSLYKVNIETDAIEGVSFGGIRGFIRSSTFKDGHLYLLKFPVNAGLYNYISVNLNTMTIELSGTGDTATAIQIIKIVTPDIWDLLYPDGTLRRYDMATFTQLSSINTVPLLQNTPKQIFDEKDGAFYVFYFASRQLHTYILKEDAI